MTTAQITIVGLFGSMAFALALLWRDRQRLKRRLAAAEARHLRTQFNPHFLYNALNAISELGYNNPKTADNVVTQLSQLLRKSLDDSEQTEIALSAEIAFLERYLNIQKVLLGDRLHIMLDIDTSVVNARVPGMIIQPLAENALTHGVGSDAIASLRVSATRDGSDLVITVEDTGPGLRNATGSRGIGLANIRARLSHLYGNTASLRLLERPAGGLVARLTIPFHEGYAYSEAPGAHR